MSYPKDVFSRMYSGLSKVDDGLLYPKEEEKEQDVDLQEVDETLQTNIFNTMLSRRSQRKFEDRQVEDSKVEMIFAACLIQHPQLVAFRGLRYIMLKIQRLN